MAVPYDNDNVFAKILDGVIPSFKIFETEHVLAILDAFPLVPGHALLIPKARGFATVDGSKKSCPQRTLRIRY
jgi:histidine triad (HIT) family protein